MTPSQNDTPSAASTTSAETATPPSSLADLSASVGLPEPLEDSFRASDGARLRYAHWPTAADKRQGSVLYLNGRTEFIEKTMEAYAILCRSGLDVWTLDWRGQGLSSRPLGDPGKGHISDYQRYLDDLHGFIHQATKLPRKRERTIMLAHSMGGHIGLRYLHDHPGLFDAAVFSAPMIDLAVNRAPLRLLNGVLAGLGFGEHYALGTGRFRFTYANPADSADNGDLQAYRQRVKDFRILTHDAGKFMEIQRLIRANPALGLGGPTVDWLAATFHSINLTWAPGYAQAIETPVLMVGGGQDKVVVTARQKEMATHLPHGRFQVMDKAAHELLVECDDVRMSFFQAFADFTGCSLDLPAPDMSGCLR